MKLPSMLLKLFILSVHHERGPVPCPSWISSVKADSDSAIPVVKTPEMVRPQESEAIKIPKAIENTDEKIGFG